MSAHTPPAPPAHEHASVRTYVRVAVVLTLAPAPAVGAPPHVHRTEREAFYIPDARRSCRFVSSPS